MDDGIFKKLRLKADSRALSINEPKDYPRSMLAHWQSEGPADFVHLFVKTKAEFDGFFQRAASSVRENGVFWVSYPKSSRKETFDINRDKLWDMAIPRGWHPVSQVSLDDLWSAVRLKRNEVGKEYIRPNAH